MRVIHKEDLRGQCPRCGVLMGVNPFHISDPEGDSITQIDLDELNVVGADEVVEPSCDSDNCVLCAEL